VDSIGRPVRSEALIVSAINRWVKVNDPEAKIGQLAAADLVPYTTVIGKIIEITAAITSTPYSQLLNEPTSVPRSGEAIKAAERSLDGKVDGMQTDFGEAWEEVIRLAFLTVGDLERASTRSETRWKPATSASETQHADTLVKLVESGVIDTETAMEMWPFSQEQITRILSRQAAAKRAVDATPAGAVQVAA